MRSGVQSADPLDVYRAAFVRWQLELKDDYRCMLDGQSSPIVSPQGSESSIILSTNPCFVDGEAENSPIQQSGRIGWESANAKTDINPKNMLLVTHHLLTYYGEEGIEVEWLGHLGSNSTASSCSKQPPVVYARIVPYPSRGPQKKPRYYVDIKDQNIHVNLKPHYTVGEVRSMYADGWFEFIDIDIYLKAKELEDRTSDTSPA